MFGFNEPIFYYFPTHSTFLQMNLNSPFSIIHLNTGLMPYYWTHFPFYISLGKYKLPQIWSSLTYFVSSALCFLNKTTYLLTIIIMERWWFVCMCGLFFQRSFLLGRNCHSPHSYVLMKGFSIQSPREWHIAGKFLYWTSHWIGE